MEGFYYDAQIQHITEIVKNSLYFAVLEGEEHKTLKNTVDTVYYCTDNELLYNNYYFDFGPLNISCLYKYCCKLNNYLQYSQGLKKRVVHYTSANSSKRSNAAFLIGCYTIIYLKTEPSDILETLENAGGSYREFVDASQGGSQFTIGLLDCFQAIQKAISFNFFQLNDFNVFEYDYHDKLQNGDMNWLVPRKFLAFIGPTSNEFGNGHHPDFYIKYFLDNDVKTVIRLNNKLYDASSFTRKGIDHFDLFFPDGTVPSKSILLQFLEISETARAAIAVHCKAGLGRTGSLIGAYIIKHYQLTAREAIAWMRICRPGSVIGQQQGWLEKIESWLWKQGSHYRIQHFGEGDKIPRHKYGIYSKEWPKERENLIKHVQKRRLDAQYNKTKFRSDNVSKFLKDYTASAQVSVSDVIPNKPSEERRNSARVQKNPAFINTGFDQFAVCTDGVYQTRENISARNSSLDRSMQKIRTVHDSQYKDNVTPRPRSKRRNSVAKHKDKQNSLENSEYNETNTFNTQGYLPSSNSFQVHTIDPSYNYSPVNNYPIKMKRREPSPGREPLGVVNQTTNKVRRNYNENSEQTQGDKLNDIKAKKFANFTRDSTPAKIRSAKTRRESDISYNKPEASTSKFGKGIETRPDYQYENPYQ